MIEDVCYLRRREEVTDLIRGVTKSRYGDFVGERGTVFIIIDFTGCPKQLGDVLSN